MIKAVQFRKDFGLDNDWQDLKMGDLIKSDIPDLIITDLEMAIKLVNASKITTVLQLRKEEKGGVMEWDNF